ncbi:hypothetical protein Tco_0848133 [Tanacetum coccineum]
MLGRLAKKQKMKECRPCGVMRSGSCIKSSSRHEVTIPNLVFRCSEFGGVTRMVKVEVNEIRAETLARISNSLALKQPPSTRSYATTRNKGKEIVKAPSTPLESDCEHDSDGEQTQKD